MKCVSSIVIIQYKTPTYIYICKTILEIHLITIYILYIPDMAKME